MITATGVALLVIGFCFWQNLPESTWKWNKRHKVQAVLCEIMGWAGIACLLASLFILLLRYAP